MATCTVRTRRPAFDAAPPPSVADPDTPRAPARRIAESPTTTTGAVIARSSLVTGSSAASARRRSVADVTPRATGVTSIVASASTWRPESSVARGGTATARPPAATATPARWHGAVPALLSSSGTRRRPSLGIARTVAPRASRASQYWKFTRRLAVSLSVTVSPSARTASESTSVRRRGPV